MTLFYQWTMKSGKFLLVLSCLVALAGCYRKGPSDDDVPATSFKTLYYHKVGQSYFINSFAQGEYPEYLDGGYVGFLNDVYDHIEYPKQAKANHTEGKVVLYYLLKPDGTVSEVIIDEDLGDGCGEAASEAVRKALKGQPFEPSDRVSDLYGLVRVYFDLP